MVDIRLTDEKGNRLISVIRCDEQAVLRQYSPMTHSLIVCMDSGDERVLVVENNWKQEWELPGGIRERSESPRECALRELKEETGHVPQTMEFYGLITWRLGAEQRVEHGCLYTCRVTETAREINTDEIGQAGASRAIPRYLTSESVASARLSDRSVP